MVATARGFVRPSARPRPPRRVRDAYLMLAVAGGFGDAPCAGLLAPGADPDEVLRRPPAPPAVPSKLTAASLDAATLARVRAAVALDLQLYDACLELFERQLAVYERLFSK